jgi:hypothetical protein
MLPSKPEGVMPGLDRETIDLVARAVVSGRRGFGTRIDRLADVVAGLMRNRLAAVGVGGAMPPQRPGRRRAATASVESRLLVLLIERAGKHLAAAAARGRSDASPHPR